MANVTIKADLGNRLLAGIIDYFVVQFISNFILTPLSFLGIIPLFFMNPDSKSNGLIFFLLLCIWVIALLFVAFAISYVYYIWLPVKYWHGATLGKRAMKQRVVMQDGSEAGQFALFMREFVGKFVSAAAMMLGYIWILVDEKGLGWHDMLANTIVIDDQNV
jgi:uncharacterized RDD family membrane protein YckC